MSAADEFRELFEMGGRRVTLQRTVPNQQPQTLPNVRARVRGYTPEEIAGGVNVGSRKVTLLAEDVPANWLPLRATDAIVVDGIRMAFKNRPDDQTHRDGEVLLAIVCEASGS